MCGGCRSWRRLYPNPGTCRICGRELHLGHALTSGQLRILKTTDLHDGRLFLPNRTVLLADPVRTRLAAYLDHRNHRWPRTANPHLFVSQVTGCGVEPVSHAWINDVLGIPTAGSARTASSTRPRPPVATSAASATCSDCPSARPFATPAPSTNPASSNTASATRDPHRGQGPSSHTRRHRRRARAEGPYEGQGLGSPLWPKTSAAFTVSRCSGHEKYAFRLRNRPRDLGCR